MDYKFFSTTIDGFRIALDIFSNTGDDFSNKPEKGVDDFFQEVAFETYTI